MNDWPCGTLLTVVPSRGCIMPLMQPAEAPVPTDDNKGSHSASSNALKAATRARLQAWKEFWKRPGRATATITTTTFTIDPPESTLYENGLTFAQMKRRSAPQYLLFLCNFGIVVGFAIGFIVGWLTFNGNGQ